MSQQSLYDSSNRTIVGLKLNLKVRKERFTEQQSHHCGIETLTASERPPALPLAAIAPLWD